MNSVTISGNVTRDPELVAPNGSEYTLLKFGVANNDESKKNQQGGYDQITSFFDVNYWTKNPQLWLQRIKKGAGIVVLGKLKQERWDQDGQTRSKVTITVDRFSWPIIEAGRDTGAPNYAAQDQQQDSAYGAGAPGF